MERSSNENRRIAARSWFGAVVKPAFLFFFLFFSSPGFATLAREERGRRQETRLPVRQPRAAPSLTEPSRRCQLRPCRTPGRDSPPHEREQAGTLRWDKAVRDSDSNAPSILSTAANTSLHATTHQMSGTSGHAMARTSSERPRLPSSEGPSPGHTSGWTDCASVARTAHAHQRQREHADEQPHRLPPSHEVSIAAACPRQVDLHHDYDQEHSCRPGRAHLPGRPDEVRRRVERFEQRRGQPAPDRHLFYRLRRARFRPPSPKNEESPGTAVPGPRRRHRSGAYIRAPLAAS
jgi:hypothetical protein